MQRTAPFVAQFAIGTLSGLLLLGPGAPPATGAPCPDKPPRSLAEARGPDIQVLAVVKDGDQPPVALARLLPDGPDVNLRGGEELGAGTVVDVSFDFANAVVRELLDDERHLQPWRDHVLCAIPKPPWQRLGVEAPAANCPDLLIEANADAIWVRSRSSREPSPLRIGEAACGAWRLLAIDEVGPRYKVIIFEEAGTTRRVSFTAGKP